MTEPELYHKPEPMHTGICPVCKRRKVAVLAHPKGDKTVTRCYYIRRHKCGRRLEPVAGSLELVRSNPELSGTTRWTTGSRS